MRMVMPGVNVCGQVLSNCSPFTKKTHLVPDVKGVINNKKNRKLQLH